MPKVRLSNGTVVDTDQLNWSPSAGGGTMYDATRLGAAPFSPPPVPAPIGGLTTRKVQTYGVAPDGTPIVPSANGSAFSGGWGSTGFVLPGMNQPTQTAMLPYPEDSRTTPAQMNSRDVIEDIPAPQVAQAPQNNTIDATNPIDMYRQFGIMPSGPQNPALSAIDQLTGSGRSTNAPFPLPAFRQPTYSPPVDITVNGGAPQAPMPLRSRPLTPYMTSPSYMTTPGSPFSLGFNAPAGGNYTVKRGDTVWDLARKNNTTVNAIALANGLSDPGKIRAGQQLTIPSVPAPRMRPPAMGGSKTPSGMTVDEVGAFRYHG